MAQKSIGNRHRGRVIVHFEGLFPFYGSPGNIGPSRVPTIQRVGLYRFFFYSADGGKAPHAHAERERSSECSRRFCAPLTKNVQGIEPPAQSIRFGDWLRSRARYPRESIHEIEVGHANSDPGHSENQFRDTDERHRHPAGRDFPGDGQVRLRPRLGPSSTGSGYLFWDDQVLKRRGGRLRHP